MPQENIASSDDESRWTLPMKDVVAMSECEYREACLNLEADNMHPECIVLEAKRSGKEDFVGEAEALLAAQEKAGELTPDLHVRRKALYAAMKSAK